MTSAPDTTLSLTELKPEKLQKIKISDPDYFFGVDTSEIPLDSVGLFTFLRTYARKLDNNDPNSYVETWAQTLKRVVLACNTQLKCGFKKEEQKELFELLYNLKGSVAGRFLWQLGTETVNQIGMPSLMNCFKINTEFWTSEGIKTFADFKDGDSVVVRGRDEWMNATVHSYGEQQLYELTIEEINTGEKDTIFSTANHRWVVYTGEGNDEMYQNTVDLLPQTTLVSVQKDIMKPQLWRVVDVKPTDQFETVWCVSEPIYEEFTLGCGVVTKNCAYVTVNTPIDSFTWTMNKLMLGCGVGYRLLPEDLANESFPIIKHAEVVRKDTHDADFIVPDSRDGWVKLLGRVLKSHFFSGKNFSYSCCLLRSRGAPIKGFGGTASGPDVLCDGMQKINVLLNSREGQMLRPVDALDIMNIIAYIVVAGKTLLATVSCV